MCITSFFCAEYEVELGRPKEECVRPRKQSWPKGWPIPRIALASFVDLGVSDDDIAHYFKVTAEDVRILREKYWLNDNAPNVAADIGLLGV